MKGNSQALPALCLAFCKKEYYPFCIPAFRFLPWGAGHPRRLMSIWARSQDHPQAGPDSPDPLSSPKPPITCGARVRMGRSIRELSALPRCAWQAQPSLNDTLPPALLLE